MVLTLALLSHILSVPILQEGGGAMALLATSSHGPLAGGAIRTLTPPPFFYYGIHSLMFGGYPPTAIGYPPTAIVGRIGHSGFFFFITAPPDPCCHTEALRAPALGDAYTVCPSPAFSALVSSVLSLDIL